MKLLSQFLGKDIGFRGQGEVVWGERNPKPGLFCQIPELKAHSCFAFLQLTYVDLSIWHD